MHVRVRLSLLAGLLLVATPVLGQKPADLVPIRVFTAPDDGGFVTAESKSRQKLLQDVSKKLTKDKSARRVLRLADDAAVTIEILSVGREETGTSETQVSGLGRALKTPELTETRQIRKTTVRAMLRFGEYEKELVSSYVDGEMGDTAIWFREAIVSFVGDNAAKFRSK